MTTPSGRIRSFIAIQVSTAGIQALEDTVQRLDSELGRSVRWVRSEGIHLTLKFMGDIQAEMAERVLAALPPVAARFSPFELSISGLGVFPNPRRPRVLWAGVHGDLGPCRHCNWPWMTQWENLACLKKSAASLPI